MKCPVDNDTLVMTERRGVEIDYCPQCRGVWLDRGELDKVIERAAGTDDRRDSAYAERRSERDDPDGHRLGHGQDDDDRGHPPGGRRRKRGSFLSEMFEFGE